MKYFLILLFIVNISGCMTEINITGRYTCTEEQMIKVEKETLFCTNSGGYIKSYCYDTAIMRNCEPIRIFK